MVGHQRGWGFASGKACGRIRVSATIFLGVLGLLGASCRTTCAHRAEFPSSGAPANRQCAANPDAAEAEALLAGHVQRVEERIEAFHQANGMPGVTAGFMLRDGQRAAASAGVSCRSDGRPMEPDDRMLSGSIGKTYVSAVLLQLVDEGRVALDRKIAHWFGSDSWFTRLPNAQDITLRMLMNHTSGIPRHIFTPDFQAAVAAQPQKIWKPEELVSYVLDAEPLFPAGQGWSYADTNYILVGMIIERVTGQSYYQELSRRILVPLGLRDTTPSDRPDIPRLACGYTSETNPFSLPVEAARRGHYAMNPQVEWTGGGLVNTSLDLARWAWLLYGGRVVRADSLRQMCEGVPMAPDSEQEYGLGVMKRPSPHGPVLGHSGWMPGYVSTMAYYPDHGLAVAVQINTEIGVTRALLEELVDKIATDLLAEVPPNGP